jgi:transcriptional regulator with XRE-family HTH domain
MFFSTSRRLPGPEKPQYIAIGMMNNPARRPGRQVLVKAVKRPDIPTDKNCNMAVRVTRRFIPNNDVAGIGNKFRRVWYFAKVFYMTFMDRLEAKIRENKTTQKEAAEFAGLTGAAITEWKKDKTIPRADVAIKIAEYLNVSVYWLITGKESKFAGIHKDEMDLIEGFRLLDSRGKEDISGIIKLKIKNAKKGDILSSSGNA